MSIHQSLDSDHRRIFLMFIVQRKKNIFYYTIVKYSNQHLTCGFFSSSETKFYRINIISNVQLCQEAQIKYISSNNALHCKHTL